jgi:signal transduction histidine kinase
VTGAPSLLRTFAVLSLMVIGLITTAQIVVQWRLLREGLLDWERTTTSETVRGDATAALRAEDFERWQAPEAQARFVRFFQLALAHPEILRVKVYGADQRVVWSDEPRLLGVRFPDNARLQRALRGETVAHLERAAQPENLYERGFASAVELYVPLSFPGPTPGTARVAGVVEIYKDPSRRFANLTRDRLTIIATSVGGAVLLWTALFWVVSRAARQLRQQRRDLAEQAEALRRAGEELRAAHQQLGDAERLAAVGEVSATVAHGIRNPLAAIRASAQVALDARGDHALVERYLVAIVAETDRLSTWLRALLDAVRPFEPSPAPVDVNALVGAVVGLLGPRAAEREVRLDTHLATGLPTLHADEVHLQQALLGILENALEAVGPRGQVEVRTEPVQTPPGVRITVRDDGVGIPPERLPRIFEPFVTSKPRGTGLGLAIARKVVERHGGRVAVESRPAAGTSVSVVLPVPAAEVGALA